MVLCVGEIYSPRNYLHSSLGSRPLIKKNLAAHRDGVKFFLAVASDDVVERSTT